MLFVVVFSWLMSGVCCVLMLVVVCCCLVFVCWLVVIVSCRLVLCFFLFCFRCCSWLLFAAELPLFVIVCVRVLQVAVCS